MNKKRTIRYIAIGVFAIAAVVLMIILIKPFSNKKEQEQEYLAPIDVSEKDLVSSYATVTDYYEAIGEDPNEIFHSEQGLDLSEYPYRAFVKNRGILYGGDIPEDCGNGLEPCLSIYIDGIIPDGDNYAAEISETSLRELSTGCIYHLILIDYDNLDIRVYYDNASHAFAFASELDPEKEKTDEERPSYRDYIIQEITDTVTEDIEETKKEFEEYENNH